MGLPLIGEKMKETGKIVFVFIAIAVIFACQVFGPVFSANFSEASYVANKALPAVVLVYSVLEYSARVYIPWDTGAEEYIANDYIAAMGSGFFINPNGYIVTNGHVVFCLESTNYKDDIYTKRDIITSATMVLIEYVQNQLGILFTQDDVQYILNYNLQNGQVIDSHRSVYVILGEATGNIIEAHTGYAASVVATSPFLGRDLAILKVELTNTPALLIVKNPDEVSVGDQVYALGYPGVATFHPMLSDKTLLDPSFTEGVVSAKKLTSEDVSAIQHSADITHGNSGGPLVNDEGKVVGVNNMGSINDLGLEVAGFNFAVACNVLLDFLRENGVQNSIGSTTTEYDKGLAYYYAKMYGSAKAQFEAVTAVFPYHWKAQQLIQECQSKILSGEKAESAITLSVNPLQVKVNEGQIKVSGNIYHSSDMPIPVNITWTNLQVTIEYTKPDGTKTTRAATVSTDGTFEDTLIPDKSGTWSVKASWDGDTDHLGAQSNQASFTVEEPAMSWMWIVLIVMMVSVVAAVSAIMLAKKRKKVPPAP